MNVLFISLVDIKSLDEPGIYTDLLHCLRDDGHGIYVLSPVERRLGVSSHVIRDDGTVIVKPRIGNVQKTGMVEKGVSTVMLGGKLRRAIKHGFADVRFDLVLYPTPPITFLEAVRFVRRRDSATTYLMLKDIFPQNAVDLGMMSAAGPRSALFKHFRRQERELYDLSDHIGCMSPANVGYLLAHNPQVNPEKVGLCPNAIVPRDTHCGTRERERLRQKYGLPLNRRVFVYGGNLGAPQGIPFLVGCLKSQVGNDQAFFLIVGDGTEYGRLESFFESEKPRNAKLLRRLPKEDYDALVGSCDVGLVLLDHRFTIPNFPSRLLSYLQARIPVLCATDDATDVGRIAESTGFGVACSSGSVSAFGEAVVRLLESDLGAMGDLGWEYLVANYDARKVARDIVEHVRMGA